MAVIPLYWGQTYTTYQMKSTIKTVHCEKCGCHFAYEMVRQYHASSTSHYMLNNQGARQAANATAQAMVDGALHHHEEPVACPDCGWFQLSMLEKNRGRFWPWTPWGSGSKIDPNREYPGHRGDFPGMPTAVKLVKTDNVPTQRVPDLEPSNIVTVRLLQDAVPPCCCGCAGQSQDTITLQTGEKLIPSIKLPICKSCLNAFRKRRDRRTYKILILPSLLICVALMFLATMQSLETGQFKGEFLVGVPICSLFTGGFASVLVLLLSNGNHLYPVRMVGLDRLSLTCRLQIDNPDYAEQLRETIGITPVSIHLQKLVVPSAANMGQLNISKW